MTEKSTEHTNAGAAVITNEILRAAIVAKEKRDDIVVVEYKVLPTSFKENGYCSVSTPVKVIAKVGSVQSVYNFFVKASLDKRIREKRNMMEIPLFQKEATMYLDILPTLNDFQRKMCGKVLGPPVPVYYYSTLDANTEIIILHNHKPDGFSIVDPRRGLDYECCKLVMKEIARFHASSIAMKKQLCELFQEYPYLHSYCFVHNSVSKYIEKNVQSVIELTKLRNPGKDIQTVASKLSRTDIQGILKRLSEPTEPNSVLCHGDLHIKNILFMDARSRESRALDLKLVDFQTVHYALPTTDLAVFFYSSTTRETRKNYLRELLGIYCSEFNQCLTILECEHQGFSLALLEDLFAQSALLGVILSCIFLPDFLSDGEITSLANTEVSEEKALTKDQVLIFETFPLIEERLFENLLDLSEMGSII